jgi:hypothetical protein
MRAAPFTTLLGAILLAASAAHAGTYKIQTMEDKGSFLGCMALNEEDNIILVGVQTGLSIMVAAPEFKVAKGDDVVGTWTIDDSKSLPLANKANGNGMVSIDLEPTKENFQLVAGGDELKVSLGKATHTFDLAGSKQGLLDLTACMNKNGK